MCHRLIVISQQANNIGDRFLIGSQIKQIINRTAKRAKTEREPKQEITNEEAKNENKFSERKNQMERKINKNNSVSRHMSGDRPAILNKYIDNDAFVARGYSIATCIGSDLIC